MAIGPDAILERLNEMSLSLSMSMGLEVVCCRFSYRRSGCI
jgi:hypothetical protein